MLAGRHLAELFDLFPRGFSLPAETLRLSVKCIMYGTALIMRHLPRGGKRKLLKCVLAGAPRLWCIGMYEKLAYKGFTSTPRYDIEGRVIYGTTDEIDGFASYEAKRADGVETAFAMRLTTTLTLARNLA